MNIAVGDVFYGACATLLAFSFGRIQGRTIPRITAPVATNHRGLRVPLSLGTGLAVGYGSLAVFEALEAFPGSAATRTVGIEWLWLLLAMAVVFAAGLYDDLRPSRVHGVRTHFRELRRGHVTSGIVKLVAGVAAAVIAVLGAHPAGWSPGSARLVLAILLIAGVTNLFNLLDVAPGRALKFGCCLAAGVLVARSSSLAWASVGQTAVLLPLDVREKAMLGDAGANLLGFVLGYLLWARLSTVGVAIAVAIVLVLHALAETVTLTRIIRATPPLRWFDDLGRLPGVDQGAASVDGG